MHDSQSPNPPVDRDARKWRVAFDQFLHPFEVAMRDADGFSHQGRIQPGKDIARNG